MKLNRKERRDYLKYIKKEYAKHLKKRPFNGDAKAFMTWAAHDLVLRKKMVNLQDPEHDHMTMQNLPQDDTTEEQEDAPNPDEQEEQDNE